MRLREHEDVEVSVVLVNDLVPEGLHLPFAVDAADVREEDAKGGVRGG